jgi:hypothetical protein
MIMPAVMNGLGEQWKQLGVGVTIFRLNGSWGE